jgi:hypothetical protein
MKNDMKMFGILDCSDHWSFSPPVAVASQPSKSKTISSSLVLIQDFFGHRKVSTKAARGIVPVSGHRWSAAFTANLGMTTATLGPTWLVQV